MKPRLLTTFLFMMIAIASFALSDLRPLESALANRSYYIQSKERRIDSLRRELQPKVSLERRLAIYDELYGEYLTFRFDSAIVYLERADCLIDDEDYSGKSLIGIHKALSLATSGHFSEAISLLKPIDRSKLSEETLRELYWVMQWTYGAWGEYAGHTSFATEYDSLSAAYLDSLVKCTDESHPEYRFYYADRALRRGEYEVARDGYSEVVETAPRTTRRYAQAAYGLAMSFLGMNDAESYREWLINAAVTDQIIPLKENLALQELALDIRNRDGDMETANRYLKYSLEDAIFYNNRLRMLEITEKIPDIALGYQDIITAQNKRLKIYVLSIGILLIVLAISAYVIVREKKKLVASRMILSELNGKLSAVNEQLAQTNVWREQYVSLFMDLCAAYIEKLNKFRSTVVLKLKVRQFDDLLRVANNSSRPTESEMREVFFNFDSAFLRIYPDFVERFNELLQPDKAIIPKPNELLNTDLRIFALIRMGIKDSTKIATLLFYSPQTIFNHRTQVRNRAINRESFEQELMSICSVMPSERQ